MELCLTVPVRLSSLLPYLPMLMDPLVSALNGSQTLVSQVKSNDNMDNMILNLPILRLVTYKRKFKYVKFSMLEFYFSLYK